MSKLIKFLVERSLLVNLIAIALVIAGGVFLMNTRRVAFPEISFDMVVVYSIYPGASPLEAERNVTRPIEEELIGIPGIKEMVSTSRRGFAEVFMELEADLDNPESTINDIRQAVDNVKDLPDLAEKPVVLRIGSSVVFPALSVNLSAEDTDTDIYALADELEQRLLSITGVSSVDANGYHDPEIKVDVNPDSLRAYHVSVREIINAIRQHTLSYPCGTVDEGDTQVMVSLNNGIQTIEDIGNIAIKGSFSGEADFEGYTVRVKDVAAVSMGREESSYILRTNGRDSINLRVKKMKSGDNIAISQAVKSLIAEFQEEKKAAGINIGVDIVEDIADFIRNRLDVVRINAILGLLFVILSLFIFLNWRVAMFTAAGLPVAFGLTFIIMGYADITINMISMVGMIIVLGMLVDDAIIVAENIYRHMENGEERLRSVIQGTSEVAGPVTGTILTTMAAFIPILMIKGMMGKFMIDMPIVVVVALGASLLEALIILPVHAYDYARVTIRAKSAKAHWFEAFREKYRTFLTGAVRRRYLVAGSAIVILGILIGYFKVVQLPKFELFPSEGIEQFFVKYSLPTGTRKEKTLASVKKLEQVIYEELADNELRDLTIRIGSDETNSFINNTGEEYGIAAVYLTDVGDRDRDVEEILKNLQVKVDQLIADGYFEKCAFEKVKPGPPTGAPVSIQVFSEDFKEAELLSQKILEYLRNTDGVANVDSSFGKMVEEVEVVVDGRLAAQVGMGSAEVGEFLRAAFDGVDAASIKEGEKEAEIRVRLSEGWAESREQIKDILIENRRGNLIPLGQIASIRNTETLQAVYHDTGRRYILISGEIDSTITGPKELNDNLLEEFKDYREEFPACTLELGGEAEETDEFLRDILISLLVAIMLIFIILASIFNSPFLPFLVLSAIPFGFGGVVLAFMLHGESFTMIAFIGVVGMTGVVVNDAIVMVSYITQLRRKGVARFESIIQGGATRLRPVVLTSITTLLGLAPTAYRFGGKDPFLPLIALAIGWGLLFATMVTLILIPCFFGIGDDVRRIFKRRMT